MKALSACLVFVSAMLVLGCRGSESGQPGEQPSGEVRIVSMSPSLTEALFALGLGRFVVADTVFCVTPDEAKALPKVGAWSDANLEQVLSFRPTCVCLPATHPMIGQFRHAGIPVEPVAGRTLEDAINGIEQLGRRFRRESEAKGIVSDIRGRLDAVSCACAGQRRLSVLVVVSRTKGQGRIRDVIVAGQDGYFRQLLERLNCRCVPEGLSVSYPSMTLEGMLSLNPDVIVDIAPECASDGGAAALEDWKTGAASLDAVKGGRVLLFTENYATVPGLRTIVFVEELAERLRPFREPGGSHE